MEFGVSNQHGASRTDLRPPPGHMFVHAKSPLVQPARINGGKVTGTFGAADLEVFYAQRFLRDAPSLPDHLRARVDASAGMIRQHDG